jgi:uncharacterized protein with PQ loop repeat
LIFWSILYLVAAILVFTVFPLIPLILILQLYFTNFVQMAAFVFCNFSLLLWLVVDFCLLGLYYYHNLHKTYVKNDSKHPQISNFVKIRPLEYEFHTDRLNDEET